MREIILLILVALATLAIVGVFVARIALRGEVADSTDIVVGLLSAVLWAVVALGATNVEAQTFCCQETYSATGLSWIAAALAALSFGAAFVGTSSLVDFRSVEESANFGD
jgi:hypothetical protein